MPSIMPMRRKKWTEEEEETLINKYGEMLESGVLAKMKTRERKFQPIAAHVNMIHHVQDPITFPWQWTWKDASTKVQNMRHQYLGVKQKIRKIVNSIDSGEREEYDWAEGLTHWSNFLKYKEVFGDVELDFSDIGGQGNGGRNLGVFNGRCRSRLRIGNQVGLMEDGSFMRSIGLDGSQGSGLLGLGLGFEYEGEEGDEHGMKEGGGGEEYEYEEAEPNAESSRKKKRFVRARPDQKSQERRRLKMESGRQAKAKAKDFRGHVVVVPYSTLGHTNPMLQFAKTLASKSMLVSFVSLQFDYLKILKAQESLQSLGLHIRLESIPDEIPSHVPIDAHINDFLFYHMHNTMTGNGLETLILRLNATPNPVSCIVYDSFLPWVSKVAAKLNVPQAFFWTQSAAVLSVYYHFKNVEMWDAARNLPEDVKIPCLEGLSVADFPSPFHPLPDGDLTERKLPAFFHGLDCIPNASWILVNSFYQLERPALQYLTRLVGVEILTIGPSIPSAFLDGRNPEDTQVGANPWEGAEGISTWLNSKPHLSVVYVSFGSITSISPTQLQELAVGLERSQQNYLWVIRSPRGHGDIKALFPTGFLERTKKRGLVVEWCIQLEVLSHPSVGVFVSHCGWNSTLDALSLGIPMLALDIWTDQPTNAKFVADVWKTGLRMRKEDNGVVGRQEIERCVRVAMEGEQFEEERKNGVMWKELARRAMMEGGSSDTNVDRFIRDIVANTPKANSQE